jgi:hypothetical protein
MPVGNVHHTKNAMNSTKGKARVASSVVMNPLLKNCVKKLSGISFAVFPQQSALFQLLLPGFLYVNGWSFFYSYS